MYRLAGPKLLLFIPIVIIGIIITTITPSYFGETRILSLFALLIGEAGLSFIPVLALYPKATFTQAVLLALIYFFTTLIICFAAWASKIFGNGNDYAFILKEGEFYINTYSLFVANIFSVIAVTTNFRLIYDEELTKKAQRESKEGGYKKKSKFISFQKPLLKRPVFEESQKASEPKKRDESFSSFEKEESLGDDFIRPFEFEPEVPTSLENLPEESSGKLFAPKEEHKTSSSDFFIDEPTETYKTTKKSNFDTMSSLKSDELQTETKTSASPLSPSNIKNDLAAIFEQYSSLNAVKKLTTSKTEQSALATIAYTMRLQLWRLVWELRLSKNTLHSTILWVAQIIT